MADFLRLRYVGTARRELQTRADRLPRGWGQVLDGIAALYLTAFQEATPVSRSGDPRRPAGTMRRRWRVRAEGAGVRARRVLTNNDPALEYVRKGRAAIDNRGKGHPLAFYAGGRLLFRWRVRGVPANDFFPRARDRARRDARRAFPAQVRRVGGRVTTHW